MRGVPLLACTFLLAGCSGVFGPKPIPEWAMHSQSAADTKARRYARRPAFSQRRHEWAQNPAMTARQTSILQGDIAGSIRVPGGDAAFDLKPFTPEWHAHEEAIEARLRQRIRICGAC